MSVLVIGGCGFIGSHLVEGLLEYNSSVKVVGSSCDLENIRHLGNEIEFIRGDITNREFIDKVVTSDLEGILHLAALINVDQSIDSPQPFFDVNVMGTINVLEAARKKDIHKVLYMSTCEVYGHIIKGKAGEDYPTNPRSPYASSKFAAERCALSYSYTYSSPKIVVIRGFNQYGPRQKSGVGGAVIPRFAEKLLRNETIQIYGDGRQTRDYIYVKDTVKGIIAAFEKDLPTGEVINLATGVETPIRDIAVRLCELANKDTQRYVEFVDSRPGELQRSCGDYGKAKRLLNWTPEVSFEQGLATTFDWYRQKLLS